MKAPVYKAKDLVFYPESWKSHLSIVLRAHMCVTLISFSFCEDKTLGKMKGGNEKGEEWNLTWEQRKQMFNCWVNSYEKQSELQNSQESGNGDQEQAADFSHVNV